MRRLAFETIAARPDPLFYFESEVGASWHGELLIRGEITGENYSFLHTPVAFDEGGAMCGGWGHEKMPFDERMRADYLAIEVVADDLADLVAALRAAPVSDSGAAEGAALPGLVGALVCLGVQQSVRWLVSAERDPERPWFIDVVTAPLVVIDPDDPGRLVVPNTAEILGRLHGTAGRDFARSDSVYEGTAEAVLSAAGREAFVAQMLDPVAAAASVDRPYRERAAERERKDRS